MKTLTSLIFAILLIAAVACGDEQATEYTQENNTAGSDYFTAVVIGKDFDCKGFYDIRILNDSTINGVFLAIDLPGSLEIDGIKINIKFREANDEDKLPACTTMGPTYTPIIILSAYRIEQ